MDVGVAEHHEVGAGDAWVVFDGGIELVCEVFDVLVALLRRPNDDAHDQALNLMQLLSPMINVVKSETRLQSHPWTGPTSSEHAPSHATLLSGTGPAPAIMAGLSAREEN
jgi:hypothetical protein